VMQADTDNLEKEEAELYKEFGEGKGGSAAPKESSCKDIFVQGLRGLVDCDDSKCSST
jgi:hypothetical protein